MVSMKLNFICGLLILTIILYKHSIGKEFLKKDELLSFDLPPKGFGKYYVTVRYIEKCISQPVDVESAVIYEINIEKHNETFEEVVGFVYVPSTFKAIKGRFTPMVERNGVLKPAFNKTSDSPCEDLVMSMPLSIIFKTDKNCIFRKGNYTTNNIDPNKMLHLLFGENFMYSRVHNTLEYFTKTGSTFCFYIVVDIRPIPKFKRKSRIAKN